jgi:metallo-beta-lactamase family protein
VLGSAISVLDIEENGKAYKLAFSGDLGRPHLPILNSPEVPEGVTHLLMESTYGDRLHDSIEQVGDQLAEIINKTYKRGGKVVIPSFALERAQEIIYTLKKLISANKIPDLPVYVDSPLAIKLTEIFKLHPECYDKETFALLQGNDSPFDFPSLAYTASVEDSKKIGEEQTPSVIISASGMCEAGRILHHLMNTVGDPKNSILIVGFQAVHTLGRRIVEKSPEIKIFGESYPLKAEVHVLNGFSAHADQKGLIDFALGVKAKGPLKKITLVHGEESAQKVLQEKLIATGFSDVEVPGPGDKLEI